MDELIQQFAADFLHETHSDMLMVRVRTLMDVVRMQFRQLHPSLPEVAVDNKINMLRRGRVSSSKKAFFRAGVAVMLLIHVWYVF
jgi:hypothetical protein